MATRESGLSGWTLELAAGRQESRTSRSRRNASSEYLVLRREIDDLEIRGGDFLLVNDPMGGLPLITLVKEIVFGTDDYIVITAFNMFRKTEVSLKLHPEGTVNPQEIFMTSVADRIYVREVLEKASVLNKQDFDSIIIDDSTQDNTFLCRRGYDTYYKSFSDEFDIKQIQKDMVIDPNGTAESIKKFVVKPVYGVKKGTPTSSKSTTTPKPRPKPSSSIKSKPPPSTSIPLSDLKHVSRSRLKREKRPALQEHVVSDTDSESEDVESPPNLASASDSEPILDSESSSPEVFSSDEDYGKTSKASKIHKPTKTVRAKTTKTISATNLRKTAKKAAKLEKEKNIKDTTIGPASILINKKRRLSAEESESNSRSKEDNDLRRVKIMKSQFNSAPSDDFITALPCREEQFSQLLFGLESAIELETGTCIYIGGTPGTGKTATVRQVIKKLAADAEEGKINPFDYLEINGMKLLSPKSAYEAIWNKVSDEKIGISAMDTALEQYFSSGQAKGPLVVLLDELDQIASSKGQSVLYNFFNWPTYAKSKLIVIAVSNTMDLPERILSNKVSSRLGLTRIQFSGYTHEELKRIIQSRLSSLESGKIEMSNDAIVFASRKVASVSGDARRALKICRRAIELAEENGRDLGHQGNVTIVQISHINRATNETTNSAISGYISTLSFLGKLVLIGMLSKKRRSGLAENALGDIIDEIKQIIEVYSAKDNSSFIVEGKKLIDIFYEDFIIRPKGFTFILNELIETGIVIQQNRKSERTSLVKLNVADEEISSTLKNDKTVRHLIDLTN